MTPALSGPDVIQAFERIFGAARIPFVVDVLGVGHWNTTGDRTEMVIPFPGRALERVPFGEIHGGVMTGLVDSALTLAIFRTGLVSSSIATIDLAIECHLPSGPRRIACGEPITAEATVREVVNGIVTARGSVLQAGQTLATATGGFLLSDSGDAVSVGTEPAPTALPGSDRPLTHIPFARHLGIRVAEGPGEPVCRLPYRPDLLGHVRFARIHGGATAALMEVAAGLAAATSRDALPPATLALAVDYLRPAGSRDLFAAARSVDRAGGRIEVEVEAWQADPRRPVATATVSLVAEPEGTP